MNIQNAGKTIFEVRKNAGLTQEELSEGICSALSLSRIENGITGVSPSTFQALMSRVGVDCEVMPIFANRADFDCFYILKTAQFYLDGWQLSLAYTELEKIKNLNWAENKMYYQEWLFLENQLQLRSGSKNYSDIYDSVLVALSITKPHFSVNHIECTHFSNIELRLYMQLAQTAFFLEKMELCRNVCELVSDYLSNSCMSKKEQLLAENAITYSGYLLKVQKYEEALHLAETYRHEMAVKHINAPLHELIFMTALCRYHLGDTESAITYFCIVFYSAHSIESCYATICRNYVQEHLHISLPEHVLKCKDIPLVAYPSQKIIEYSSFGDGEFDIFSPDTVTIGTLIRQLRTERHITMETLCYGLCSKSKLSKIENNLLQPEIILAQNLLQRLGISDSVFLFFGSEKETMLQQIMEDLVNISLHEKEAGYQLAEQLESLCGKKDKLYLQYALFKKSTYQSDKKIQMQQIQKALEISVPDFKLSDIKRYRLSRVELNILNNLGANTFDENPTMGIWYLYKVLDYLTENMSDVLAKKRALPVTIGMITGRLRLEERYMEAKKLIYPMARCPELRSHLYFTAMFFTNYCLILFKSKEITEDAMRYAYYGYYGLLVNERISSSDILKRDLLNEFGINLYL